MQNNPEAPVMAADIIFTLWEQIISLQESFIDAFV